MGILGAPVPWWGFLALLAIPYLWFGLLLGATFWIDGFCYAGLGASLSDAAAYREFNTGYGRLALSHLQIGLPALAWLLDSLPAAAQWPVLEIFQRLVSFGSLVFALGVMANGSPRVVHVLTGWLMAWNPFFQSFHNAFMTESLSGSLLLCGFALSLWMFRGRSSDWRMLVALGATIFLVTQFRSYYGAIIFCMVAAVVWIGRVPRRLFTTLVLGATTVVAGLFYPACRWVATGNWFLPGVGVNQLLVAVYLNPAPGAGIAERIQTFSPEERAAMKKILIPDGAFDVTDAKKLVLLMLKSGMSEREVDAKLKSLGRAILTERPEFLAKRVRHGLASSGLVETSGLWSDGVEMFRGLTPEAYLQHQRDVLNWHSWLSNEDYRTSFASFFATPRDIFPATAAGQEWIRRTEASYVRGPTARWIRDPLGLGHLPADVWAWAGILSSLILIGRGNVVGLLVMGAVAANFLVAFAVPVGNPRYAYGVLPLYLLAMGALLSAWFWLPGQKALRISFRDLLFEVRRPFRKV
jgi:hypothetical protein